MVARSGPGWKLAPCLVAMVEEADRLAPQRIRKADGSIGDAAHRNRTSDHNPAPDGYVYALDLTHAPASGFDAHARARQLVARRDRRLKYVISDRQIARGYDKPGIPAWTWEPYTGSNPHVFHAHFSVDAAFRNDIRPWWPPAVVPTPELPEDPMAYQLDIRDYVIACYTEAGRKGDPGGVNYWALTAADHDDPKGVLNYMRVQLGLKPVA